MAKDSSGTLYRLDDQVGYLLRLANQRHAMIFQTHMVCDLTPTQFAAMVRLAEHGRCSQNQLGRHAAMDVATIKGVVDRLRQKGLVETTPSLEDRRRQLISLTAQGNRILQDLYAQGQRVTEATLEPLSPAEQKTLVRLLGKIG